MMKYGLVFLSILILFPSATKLAHNFTNHEHIYCDHYSDSHFHQDTLDCELFKFQQSSFTSLVIYNYELFRPKEENPKSVPAYYFLSDHQKLPFSLRGPPAVL